MAQEKVGITRPCTAFRDRAGQGYGHYELDKMKRWSIQPWLLVLVTLSACRSFDAGVRTAEKPAFTETEIRSKVWSDPKGRQLRLVDWSVVKLAGLDELLLVKFGDPDTGVVTCLEFYRIEHRPGGTFLLSDGSSQASAPAPATGRLQYVPPREIFILLEHDYEPGIVTKVKPAARDGEAFFIVTRETEPRGTGHRQGVRYTLICDKNYRMRSGLDVGTWDIPDGAPHN